MHVGRMPKTRRTKGKLSKSVEGERAITFTYWRGRSSLEKTNRARALPFVVYSYWQKSFSKMCDLAIRSGRENIPQKKQVAFQVACKYHPPIRGETWQRVLEAHRAWAKGRIVYFLPSTNLLKRTLSEMICNLPHIFTKYLPHSSGSPRNTLWSELLVVTSCSDIYSVQGLYERLS